MVVLCMLYIHFALFYKIISAVLSELYKTTAQCPWDSQWLRCQWNTNTDYLKFGDKIGGTPGIIKGHIACDDVGDTHRFLE